MSEADYICVLDTGSTDNTVEKLKQYDNVIVEQKEITPWRFDVARNESMKLIPRDANILCCIDLDEVFDPGWAQPLRKVWQEWTERAWYMYVWSHDEYGNAARKFKCNKIHSPNYYWKYPVHELLVRREQEVDENSVAIDVSELITLQHHPDVNKSRGSYLPLLEQRKAEDPDEYCGRIYLAHEYCYRGLYEKSNQELAEILEKFNDGETMNKTDIASCYLFMGDNYYYMGEYNKALQEYDNCVQADWTYREGYLGCAKILIEKKYYDIAIWRLKNCIKNGIRHYSWLERDNSWTWEPWDMLAGACFYNGDKAESIAFAAKALTYSPQDERLITNLQACINNSTDKELVYGLC